MVEETKKESQQVWGYPVTSWSVAIAKIQIVWCAISSFTFLMILASCLTRGESKVLKSIQDSDHILITPYHDSSFKTIIWLLILFMILNLIGFFMAFILLKGVQKKNPHRLMYWFKFTGVCLGIHVLWIISIVQSSNVPLVLLSIVTSVTVITFAMSLVYTLQLELDSDEKTQDPHDEAEEGGTIVQEGDCDKGKEAKNVDNTNADADAQPKKDDRDHLPANY